jgi:hypothetical protein
MGNAADSNVGACPLSENRFPLRRDALAGGILVAHDSKIKSQPTCQFSQAIVAFPRQKHELSSLKGIEFLLDMFRPTVTSGNRGFQSRPHPRPLCHKIFISQRGVVAIAKRKRDVQSNFISAEWRFGSFKVCKIHEASTGTMSGSRNFIICAWPGSRGHSALSPILTYLNYDLFLSKYERLNLPLLLPETAKMKCLPIIGNRQKCLRSASLTCFQICGMDQPNENLRHSMPVRRPTQMRGI